MHLTFIQVIKQKLTQNPNKHYVNMNICVHFHVDGLSCPPRCGSFRFHWPLLCGPALFLSPTDCAPRCNHGGFNCIETSCQAAPLIAIYWVPAVLLRVLMNEWEAMRANELLQAYRASDSGRGLLLGESRCRRSVSPRSLLLVCLR